MLKLKIESLSDDKPIKVSLDLPAPLHRDLVAYAEILARETGEQITHPARLIAPVLARFMATDRSFLKARRAHQLSRRGDG